MASGSTRTIEVDKVLILTALGALVALGWFSGAPIFEPFGHGRLTYLTVLGLPLVALFLLLRRASGEMGKLLASWWPVVGILAVYESLKHMHANRITEWLGIRPKDELMLRIDEALFGQALPLWMDSWTAPWFQNLMSFFYIWVYYLGPVVLLAVAYLARRDDLFRRLRLGLVFGLLGGYVLYLLVPVAGPLFLVGDRFQNPIPSQSRLETLVFDTLRFNWDCFPSLHTAIPWILTVLIWRWLPRWAVVVSAVLACGVTLSTVALRLHYGIDLIAAFVWVGIVAWAVERAGRRDFGRIEVPWFKARRRLRARASDARAALRRTVWAGLAICAAALPALVAYQRWMELWLGAPLRSVTGVLLGGALGLGGGAALASRLRSRSRSPMLTGAIACLGLAGWILLIGSPLLSTSVVGWSAKLLDALGSSALETSGLWVVAGGTLPLAGLLGFALSMAASAGRAVGLPAVPLAFWRSSFAGALGGLLLARFELAPRAGWGDTVLVCALAAIVAAWQLRGADRSIGRIARSVGEPAAGWGAREAVATMAGIALGIVIPLWSFLYPPVFGPSSRPFAAVVSVVLAGALSALLLAGWRRLPTRGVARAGGSLCLFALALALTARFWADAPRRLSGAIADLPSVVAVERVRGITALLLMLVPSLFLTLALRSSIAARVAGGGNAMLGALVGVVVGSSAFAFVGLEALGSAAAIGVTGVLAGAVGAAVAMSASGSRLRIAIPVLALLPLLALGFGDWNLSAFTTGPHAGVGRRFSAPLYSSPVYEDPTAGFVAVLSGERAPGDRRRWLVASGLLHAEDPDPAAEAAARLGISSARGRARALVVGAHRATARALLRSGVAEVELVEPSETILRAAAAIDPAGADPAGLTVRVGTARGRLVAGGNYDLVISRVEDFWLGVERGELGTDFYRRVDANLADGGAFVQTIRLDACGTPELVSVVAALASVMPRLSARLLGDRLLLVAPKAPNEREVEDLAERAVLAQPTASPLQEPNGSPLLGPEQLGIWVALGGRPPSADRDGTLESRAPDYRLAGDLSAMNVAALRAVAAKFPPPRVSSPGPAESAGGSEPADTE